jgi:hypothetical protein
MVILALLGIFMDRKMYGKKMPASKYRASKHRLPASRTDNNRRSGSNQSFEGGVTASKTKLTEITTKQTCSLKYQKPKRHERRGVWKPFTYAEVHSCVQTTDHVMILAGCGELLATGRIAGLFWYQRQTLYLVHSLKTSSVLSSVQWATALCEYFQDGC